MFGPIRGPWPDHEWVGWWGDELPYHCPVCVLTHHLRPPLEMAGGATFHFVTSGIHGALDQARQAANGADVRIGGGVDTIGSTSLPGSSTKLTSRSPPVLRGAGDALFPVHDLPAVGPGFCDVVTSVLRDNHLDPAMFIRQVHGERAGHIVIGRAP